MVIHRMGGMILVRLEDLRLPMISTQRQLSYAAVTIEYNQYHQSYPFL